MEPKLPVWIWLRSHQVTGRAFSAYMLGWVGVVALCYIGLPAQLGPTPAASVELQVLGLVGLAAISSVPAIWLTDTMSWLGDVTARPLPLMRLVWGGAVAITHLTLAAVTIPLLPQGFVIWEGYFVVATLWLGVAMTTRIWWGATAGAVVPLGLAVLLTTTILPWKYNMIFNSGLSALRIAIALLFLAVTVGSLVCKPRDSSRGQ